MIPNFTPIRVIQGTTLFKNTGTAIQTLINDLYVEMGTTASGTTYDGFKNGLLNYIRGKGYTFRYEEMRQNHAAARTWIDGGKPVALFLNTKFNLISEYDIVDKGSYDEYSMRYYSGNHVVLCFGYRTITYYSTDGSVKENHRMYLCYSGISDMPFAYVDLDRTVTVGGMIGIDVVD